MENEVDVPMRRGSGIGRLAILAGMAVALTVGAGCYNSRSHGSGYRVIKIQKRGLGYESCRTALKCGPKDCYAFKGKRFGEGRRELGPGHGKFSLSHHGYDGGRRGLGQRPGRGVCGFGQVENQRLRKYSLDGKKFDGKDCKKFDRKDVKKRFLQRLEEGKRFDRKDAKVLKNCCKSADNKCNAHKKKSRGRG